MPDCACLPLFLAGGPKISIKPITSARCKTCLQETSLVEVSTDLLNDLGSCGEDMSDEVMVDYAVEVSLPIPCFLYTSDNYISLRKVFLGGRLYKENPHALPKACESRM